QAEDGIRDLYVTGVQTCALPILAPELRLAFIDPEQRAAHRRAIVRSPQIGAAAELAVPAMGVFVRQQVAAGRLFVPFGEEAQPRSEERRVGKEWRSRWGGEG